MLMLLNPCLLPEFSLDDEEIGHAYEQWSYIEAATE